MRAVHPGEVLKKEYLIPLNINAGKLAKHINVTPTRLYELVSGRRNLTANTAIRLSMALGTTPEFWMSLQTQYDLKMEKFKIINISRISGLG